MAKAPVALKLTVPPVAVILFVVVSELSVLTDSPANVSPPEVRLKAPAPLFTTIALPVVFSVKPGVDVFILPILPKVMAIFCLSVPSLLTARALK